MWGKHVENLIRGYQGYKTSKVKSGTIMERNGNSQTVVHTLGSPSVFNLEIIKSDRGKNLKWQIS